MKASPMIKPVLIALCASLAACSDIAQRDSRTFGDPGDKIARMARQVGTAKPLPTPAVVHAEGIWLGHKAIKVASAPVLPPVFREPANFDRTVSSLAELAERITMRSGIPTKVSPGALAVASGAPAPSAAAAIAGTAGVGTVNPIVPPLNPAPAKSATPKAEPVHISYRNGSFQNFLDTVAARYGVYWKYANGTIQFFHTEARSFQINALPGDATFSATVSSGATSSGGVSGGGSGGGSGSGNNGVSASNNQNTAVSSQLSVYSNLQKSIGAMLSAYGQVVASPATGSITVVDTPDALERIAAFVESENRAMARQIAINVTVLSVTLSDADEYGINWNLVYSNLLNTYGIRNTIAGAPGSSPAAFSAGVLASSNSKFAGSSLMIQALSQQGKVRRQTSASVVTLNNQPVPVQVAKQTSYLKSSETTVSPLAGSTTSLTPGVVTSGFNMSILPHLLDDGTVMLQFSTDISALRQIRRVNSGSAGSSTNTSIESPELDTRNFLQRVAMKSNETLIISGFEQTDDDIDRQGVGHPSNFLLGGALARKANKEVIVILVTPTTMAGS
ncbi:PilN family type IVB pilus formation outer membrane protein [Massilia sp. CCM 8733]|uniref:PilN family type IVB pilus formation outer membrane protein n=1 Tax=Massilia mucilaginosa TaxID=2609282 RepID=A0ABX0NWA7_9BURK|nr:PilN family type IVB pilus formation outer membrane protein [Massilia mucilaginosa]NHZ91147.1 PilN family type IVB pilus formation outer membrane protein [Massilia mucilaginosa]